MAGKHSSSEVAVFLVDGYNVLSAALQSLSGAVKAGTEAVHGLGDSWVKNSPTGLCTATLTQAGAFFDDTLNGIHDAFKAAPLTVRIAVWALTGNAIGARGFGMQGALNASYAVMPKVAGLTKADVTYTIDGQYDAGVIVMNSAAQTTNWTGTAVDYTTDTAQRVIPITSNTQANPTIVQTAVPHGLTSGQIILISGNTGSNASINGERTVTVTDSTHFSIPVNCTTAGGTGGTFVLSSTVNGGAGYQAISAFSGFSGVAGKIQHSADNSSWADLVTFTSVTAGPGDPTAAQRIAVAAGTTVNRYLRHVGTVTGSGSVTPFSVFKRG